MRDICNSKLGEWREQMYTLGQSALEMPNAADVPQILRGAAYRETLSPEQLSRLESEGIPTAKAAVNVGSVLPMLLIGGALAWAFVRRR